MSVLDYIIEIIIAFINSAVSFLPSEFSGVSVNSFSNNFFRGFQDISSGFNFIETFFPLKLALIFLTIIIASELLMSVVIKGIFWLIRTIRGG